MVYFNFSLSSGNFWACSYSLRLPRPKIQRDTGIGKMKLLLLLQCPSRPLYGGRGGSVHVEPKQRLGFFTDTLCFIRMFLGSQNLVPQNFHSTANKGKSQPFFGDFFFNFSRYFCSKVQTGFVTFDTKFSRATLARRWDQTLTNVASFCLFRLIKRLHLL